MREIEKKIREFEIKLQENMRNIFCPVHLSLGHEGVAADLSEVMIAEDWLFASHRNHHLYLAKGGSDEALWDEIMGLESGINGGFAGSQAVVDPKINFHSSAILGGLIGVATGTAYALKLNEENKAISICVIGDAGTEQGVFWESLNFAALHSLPIAFICENNGMSVDAKIEERQSTPITPRVSAFGLDTYETIHAAINNCRNLRKPVFCEVNVKLECAHINMATVLDLCEKN
jgi:TPP-dependent pyruvate/acetoin dehydrogenase alpha subunit